MKSIVAKYISFAVVAMMFSNSCLNDLNTLPLDDNQLTGEEVYLTADGYIGVLAKCYASLILTGQQGGDGGNGDVSNIDEGYSGYTRALFYLQECSTDEIAFHAGSGHGTFALLYNNWDASTRVVSYPYYRLYMAIGFCNEFLRECTESKMKSRNVYEELKDEYEYYRAEARLIRAYCYSVICDLYGSAPFVDDSMDPGTIPEQKTRKEIYDFIISEATELTSLLKEPGRNEYARVDRASAWFLLSRTYLNAEIWADTPEYENAYQYAKKIITDGTYKLAPDYRHIFLADNNTCPEIIWPLVQDADNAQGSAGTNFLIKALANGSMNNYYETGIGTRGWGNGRAKTQLVNLFDLSDQTFDTNDTWGDNKKDKRAQFFTIGHTKETWTDGAEFPRDFSKGYAIIKWRNVTKDRQELAPGGTVYSSVDYPVFRTGDAYLMAAEAILRGAGGTTEEALGYVNEIRDRACLSGDYGSGQSGRITLNELTLDFILDERGRELYTESVRRTDLVRFKKYTKGYNWDWKGSEGKDGQYVGYDIDDKYNLFPIPQDEFTTNPNLTQNPDYK